MSLLQLHHIAISVDNLEWYTHFFHDLCGMTVERTAGQAPNRNLWFVEGVQLKEVSALPPAVGCYDHFSFATANIPQVVAMALVNGCSPVVGKDSNWFCLPNGAQIELKPLK